MGRGRLAVLGPTVAFEKKKNVDGSRFPSFHLVDSFASSFTPSVLSIHDAHPHTFSKVNRHNLFFLQPAKLLCGLFDLVFTAAAADLRKKTHKTQLAGTTIFPARRESAKGH